MTKIDKIIRELCPQGVRYLELSTVCKTIKTGKQRNRDTLSKVRTSKMPYPVINGGITPSGYTGEFNTEADTITVSQGGASAGFVGFMHERFWLGAHCYTIVPDDTNTVMNRYLFFVLKDSEKILMDRAIGAGIPGLNRGALGSLKIPVPPLEVQKEIVLVLDKFTELDAQLSDELEARWKQYEYYRKYLLGFNESREEVRWLTLGDIGKVSMCKRIFKDQTSSMGDIPFYKIGTFGKSPDSFISREVYDEYRSKYSFPKKGDILLSASGTIGRTVVYDGEDAYFQDSNIIWLDNDEKTVTNKFLFHIYKIVTWQTEGGTIQRLYNDNLKKIKIAVPSLAEQHRIVSALDKFELLVNGESESLPAEISARRHQYEYYRTKLLTFQEMSV